MQTSNQTLYTSKEYSNFVLLPFNRKKINQKHVESLIESISKNNMMSTRPILCNEKLEIIDGQHRFMALRKLQLPIVYIIKEGTCSEELFDVNCSLSWNLDDFHNFYVHQGYEEYIKLNDLMLNNKFTLSFVLNTIAIFHTFSKNSFKKGKYVHCLELSGVDFSIINETNELVERFQGKQPWMSSTKFMSALSYITSIRGFDRQHWIKQVPILQELFSKRFSRSEYIRMLLTIYNFNKKKDRLECKEVS